MMQFAWVNIQMILLNVLLSDSYYIKSDAAGWQMVSDLPDLCQVS